ncbi:Mediator complex subunit MED14 domain containing protein [Amanita muscaria]
MMNDFNSDTVHSSPSIAQSLPNGMEVQLEVLERELPHVGDGQIPLSDLLSRVVQAMFAELSEMAETMPNMSDAARKRTLAEWVVKTKKQVVKLYAVVKWARDADVVQKCMNITAFLLNQNRQFEEAIQALNYSRESLDPARLRNHDLLTSLDVLTYGSYLRLPTLIKSSVIGLPVLSDSEVNKIMTDMEEVMRYRLRMSEIIPIEMARHRIEGGRVCFIVPKLFETSICLRGAEKTDGWFFVHVEFLIKIGGDLTSLQEFPRIPTGIMRRHIADEADNQLAKFVQYSTEEQPHGVELPPKPQLPDGKIDAPLVRLYNFLQMMSMSYQLEILWYQAERMRSLGWADYLTIRMSPDRKSLVASYWIRPAPPITARTRHKIPLLGGTLTVSIVETHGSPQAGGGPLRSAKARLVAKLQQNSKLGKSYLSDEVEGLIFDARWQPVQGALGVNLPVEALALPHGALKIDSNDLNFETLLRLSIDHHANMILAAFQQQLQRGVISKVFASPGVVELVDNALRVRLCTDQFINISVDARTGRISLRDTGDLAAPGKGDRFIAHTERINENAVTLLEVLMRIRVMTITDLAEQKAKYLGLQSFRRRNFPPEELRKLGPSTRGTLYIQLANFPDHYLVLVITDEKFRYALITTKVLTDSIYPTMVMEDIAWLDLDRIQKARIPAEPILTQNRVGIRRELDKPQTIKANDLFSLDTQMLRELYSYCCARVAYMNVERQFKLRGIPFTHVNPMDGLYATKELVNIQSSLARSVPALCVQSEHILSGAPAAEAAMPNIRVIPLNWWSDENAQVVTCVKLKYVQQPMGKNANASAVIRPSKRIIYDTTEAVVSFLSENVNTCVDEFLEEWARVSKMVVIAREVAQMSKDKNWQGVQLLSFDLQTVEFAYSSDYIVSITCEDQLSPTGGNFALRFSRRRPWRLPVNQAKEESSQSKYNPHDEAEPFLRHILRHGHGRLAPSLHRLVSLLRDTLPIVVELDYIQNASDREGQNISTFAKAAGWYRVLYGDLKHAMDFRLMSQQRVAILDASHSLFDTIRSKNLADGNHKVGLQPIPQFQEILQSTVKKASESLANGQSLERVAILGVGIVCGTRSILALGRGIHNRVLARLKDLPPI